MSLSETGRLVLGRQLQQPDQRSCGAAVAVMAEALRNDGYARRLLAGGDEEFDREVFAMHRRLTGPVDATGSLQAPWLRIVGTPPWALARQLARRSDGRRVVPARFRPGSAWAAMTASLARGELVPAYVGNRRLPRHVVLAVEQLEDAVRMYEPGSGRLVRATREEWTEGRLLLGGWREPWFVVSARR
ncbi:hypothetical protein CF8_3053 [Nocardioides sp. CF8]|uniref:hypothetical protein n=1 Tax=Nocardioides sp. CF8 TaxID=110319 RepID=UPI00032E3596|nr:hypothetical protein [Nocardioides sp. CF8]EON23031.1 hypothetical protein CF8_3053 [Nocardioides sp. CF8]